MAVAFVAGATGHTGRVVVDALCRRGVRTVAHVRPDSSRLEHWKSHFGASDVEVDTTEWTTAAMDATLAALQPDHVFALLGTTRRRAAGEGLAATEAYRKIDYGLSAMVIKAAAACGSGPRVTYVSAAGLSEGTSNPYMKARVDIERLLNEGALPFVIARPSFIVGDRDEPRTGERWGARVADGALSLVGALGGKRVAARYRSTTNEVLGAALVRLALDPQTDPRLVAESEDLR